VSFACPVYGCGYETHNVDSLAGHIGAKQATDPAHADYGEIHRQELLDHCRTDESLNRR
jgi:hypothetical protein